MMLSFSVALWLGAVSARAQPASAIFGERTAPRVEVTVTGKNQTPVADARVKLITSVGSFAPVKSLGEGRFQAQLILPAQHHPQLAIVLVEVEGKGLREHTWLTIPLVAHADLRIETKPRSRVTVDVGDRSFGPVVADRTGHATIAALVPPCVAVARVHVTDPAGNVSEKPLDLKPIPFPVALLWSGAERASWADQEPTPIEVFAVDASCAPVTAAAGIGVVASAGTVGTGKPQGKGVVTFPFRAPDEVGEGSTKLTVKVGGYTSAIPSNLRIAPGPQTGFAIRFDPSAFVAGSGTRVQISTTAADAHGNLIPDGKQPEKLSADFGAVQGSPPHAELAVPDAFAGHAISTVRAQGSTGASSASLDLEAGPAEAVQWTSKPRFLRAGDTFEGEARVSDRFGNATAHAPLQATLPGGAPAEVENLGSGQFRISGRIPENAPIGTEVVAVQVGPAGSQGGQLEVGQYQRPWAFLLGGSATVQTNFVHASALVPRLNLGLRIARSNFDIVAEGEASLYQAFTVRRAAGGSLSTSLTGASGALGARYSLPLAARWSLFASILAGVEGTSSRLLLLAPNDVRTQRDAKATLLLRSAVGASVAVGRGRFFAQAEGSWGPARGQLTGNLGGFGLGVGYLHAF